MDAPLPRHLVGDRWQVLRLVARGGMGAVYEARHHLTGQRAAVKILLAHVSFDPAAAERFKREVALASAIGHPGIVRVFDAGADATSGMLYFAMELLEGETLAERMQRTHDPAGALRVVAAVLEPLAVAHSKGIVHRDLKPQNVFVERLPDGSERVRLLDLGIARQVGPGSQPTITRAVIGSPGYMSPEQATSARGLTPAADVWAAGTMIYEAVAGAPPFGGETPAAAIVASCTEPHVPLRVCAPGAPPALSELVDRCLAKSPELRPADAGALRAELLPLLELSHARTVASIPTPPPAPLPPTRGFDAFVPPTAARPSGASVPSAGRAAQTGPLPMSAPRARAARSGRGWVAALVAGAVLLLLVCAGGLGTWRALRRRGRPRAVAPAGAALAPRDAAAPAAPEPAAPSTVALAPPRLLGPAPGSLVTTARPVLRFVPAPGSTGTRLELCHDRGCRSPIMVVQATGSFGIPGAPLPRGRVFWRARGLVGSSTGAQESPAWSFHVPARSAPRSATVLTYPDLDGDGLADVGVGLPAARDGQGNVRFFAATPGAGRISRQIDARLPPNPIVGMGTTLAAAGDVDGDGFTDVLLGAPESREGAGVVCLDYGGPELLGRRYMAMGGSTRFGSAVAAAGDMNGDGYGDLAVGARADGGLGVVHLMQGSVQGPVGSPAALTGSAGSNEGYGRSIAPAGDVDADGFGDLLVGAPGALGGNGRLYVVFGRGAWAHVSELVVSEYAGPDPGGALGTTVAGMGDLDGDGHADVGAGGLDRVYFLWGSASGPVRTQVARLESPGGPGIHFGAAIAGLGDVDGDGWGDLAVAAWGHERERGIVYVFSGTAQGIGPVRGYAQGPDGAGGRFGFALAAAGDVDGDGFVDLVVGAPGAAGGAGRAYVLFGGPAILSERDPQPLAPSEAGAVAFGAAVL